MTGDEIRELFLQFFQSKDHRILPSISLIPYGDPTLLLTSAGMVPIKPYFLGLAPPPHPRLVSCQKCFRTTDIDAVGDTKHLTFFEMLGNFSVGDYFKKEAIEWAWEFITQWLKLPQERIWATIFTDDEEAFHCWQELGLPETRIKRCGETDNFWGPAGNSGPCGPCSEVHYDFGQEYGCGKPDCGPDCDCPRFLEIWNLVFTQFNQDESGRRTPLPKPNIDTGMGLERTAAVMQGKVSVFETDLFIPIISSVAQLAGKSYSNGDETDRFIRIVAEHSRAIAFLIADGVVPSNEGRGYVLRRVLRRACLFGSKLGLKTPYLSEIVQAMIAKMSSAYPELAKSQDFILKVIRSEEERFAQTLDSGLNWLERELAEARREREFPGEKVFRLYDTYGFPKELTAEIAKERGFSIDLVGFEQEMALQRERARAAQKFGVVRVTEEVERGIEPKESDFVGYDKLSHSSVIVDLMVNGNSVEAASAGEEVELVLQETPFYGEMGGQVGDNGEIRGEKGKMVVDKTIRPLPELIVHQGRIVSGQLSLNEEVQAEVNQERRLDIARNHTATHLLQSALRQILGGQVYQAGSLVAPERLRFDFAYPVAPSKEQLSEITHLVNEKIRQNLPVTARILPYNQAIAEGAIALFGEKYGEEVRMVEIGSFSRELCGGTHVNSTGEIGFFHLVAESSIGAGARRIEAVTGRGAESLLKGQLAILTTIADKLESPVEELENKLTNWFEELARTQKRLTHLEQELARLTTDSLLPMVELVNGVNLLSVRVPALSPTAMREIGDQLKRKLNSGVIILGSIESDKVNFVVMVTPDLISQGFHAGKIARQVAQAAGGGGGGQAGLGQGSSKQKDRLEVALRTAKEIIFSPKP